LSTVGDFQVGSRHFTNYFLVCMEVLILGCLNLFAYPVQVEMLGVEHSEIEMVGARESLGADAAPDVVAKPQDP